MRTAFLCLLAVAFSAACSSSSSGQCQAYCKHVYTDCNDGAPGTTEAECEQSCSQGSAGQATAGCADASAFFSCMTSLSCSDLTGSAAVSCAAKCSGGTVSGTGGVASGSSSGTGGVTGGTNGAALSTYAGLVVLNQLSGQTAELASNTAAAAFALASGAGSASCNGGEVQGACCYQAAAQPTATGALPIGAGAITITDGTAPIGVLEFTPGVGYAALTSSQDPTFNWGQGAELEIQAAGDTVHTFSGTIVAPSSIDLLSPTLAPFPQATSVSGSSDLLFTWTPSGTAADQESLSLLTVAGGSTASSSITCQGPDSAGQLTVPAALLEQLPSGVVSLTLARTSTKNLAADNAQVQLIAQTALAAELSLAAAPTSGTGGTTGGGTGGSTTTGGTTGATAYCDVTEVAAENDGADAADVIWYPIADDTRTGACKASFSSGQTSSLSNLGGVLATYVGAGGVNQYVGVQPGGCDELGLAAPPSLPASLTGPGGAAFAAPSGVDTVAQAVGDLSGSLYGIVTFASGYGTPGGAAYAGNFFVQDPTPDGQAAQGGSGIQIYVPKPTAADPGLPATSPARGDVVEITGATFGVYAGIPQLTYVPGTSQITVIGQGPLPTPVSLSASELSPAESSSPYLGLRVADPVDLWEVQTACTQPE